MLIAAFGGVLAGLPASPASARVTAPAAAPGSRGPVSVPPVHPAPGLPRLSRHGALADLVVTVRQSPSSPVLRWVLTCRPDGGTLPDPARACAELSRIFSPFAPVARGIMCPMISYGPQTATVTGYWHGTWISARFSRNNGCEAARWNKVAWLFGIPHAGDPGGPVNPGGPMDPGPPAHGGGQRAG